MRREIHGGLQVVENGNSANTVLHYGKKGALTGPDNVYSETSMLALHLLQSALVPANALPVQQCSGRTNLGKEAQRRGPTGPDGAVLVQRQPVRRLPPGHGQAPRPEAGLCGASPPHLGGGCYSVDYGDTMTGSDDFRTSPAPDRTRQRGGGRTFSSSSVENEPREAAPLRTRRAGVCVRPIVRRVLHRPGRRR